MARDSWTRRLDDRVLRPTGVLIVLALVCASFLTGAISSLVEGAPLAAAIYGVLAVLSAQAVLTQWRSRNRVK